MSKDYYDILGVGKNASAEEIKNAFRKKAHEHHPDKGGNAEKFKELNEAYQVLGNAEKRQRYDQFGSAAFSQGGFGSQGFSGFSGFQNGQAGFDFEDLGEMFGGLGDIFGFGGQRRGASKRNNRGRDLEMILQLEFLEAVFGVQKEISFSKNIICQRCHGQGGEPGAKVDTCQFCQGTGRITRVQRTILGNVQTAAECPHCAGEGKIYSQRCSKCGGSGTHQDSVKLKVKIPAGINEGESVRLSGQGEAGQKGTAAGDLYLHIKIKPHRKFVRLGYDIKTEEVISFSQAALGDKIEVDTIHGPVKLKIPEGTQSGTTFRLKAKGVPKVQGHGQGDQLVKVVVKIPAGLNRKQKQILAYLGL